MDNGNLPIGYVMDRDDCKGLKVLFWVFIVMIHKKVVKRLIINEGNILIYNGIHSRDHKCALINPLD